MQTNLDERKDLLDNLNSVRTTLHLMSRIDQQAIVLVSVIVHFSGICKFEEKSSTTVNLEGTERNSQHRARFQASSASINPSISNLTCDDYSMLTPISISSSPKRPLSGTSPLPSAKRPPRADQLPISPKILPFLPVSWLEKLDSKNSELLGLMEAKSHDAGGGENEEFLESSVQG